MNIKLVILDFLRKKLVMFKSNSFKSQFLQDHWHSLHAYMYPVPAPINRALLVSLDLASYIAAISLPSQTET